MLQLRHQLGFSFKAADEIRLVGELRQDNFDSYFSIDKRLPGAVNNTIGAFADGFE